MMAMAGILAAVALQPLAPQSPAEPLPIPPAAALAAESPQMAGPWNDANGDPQYPGATYRVRLFVHAAQACLHFAGEEPYDAERAAFLNAMMDESCAGLKERYTAILADPMTDARSRELVEKAWEPFRE